MPDARFHLAIIVGSTREGRLGPAVAAWFASLAETRADLTLDVIDLADAGLPEVMSRRRSPEVDALGRAPRRRAPAPGLRRAARRRRPRLGELPRGVDAVLA